jgi:hypothetical protein
MANFAVSLSLQTGPKHRMLTVFITLVFLGAFLATWLGLRWVFSTRGWASVPGVVTMSEIEEEPNDPAARRAGERMFHYRLRIAYEYEVEPHRLRGDSVFPALPTIFTRRDHAEELQARFPVRARVPVYYRAGNPAVACLQPDAYLTAPAIVVVALVVALAVTAVGMVVFWMFLGQDNATAKG